MLRDICRSSAAADWNRSELWLKTASSSALACAQALPISAASRSRSSLALDLFLGGLRGLRQEDVDRLCARIGALKHPRNALRKGVHHALNFNAALLDLFANALKRLAARLKRLRNGAFFARENASEILKALPLAANGLREASRFLEDGAGRCIELADLRSGRCDGLAEPVHPLRERLLGRREVCPGCADRALQGGAAADEPLDDLRHSGPQPLVGFGEGRNGRRGIRIDSRAQMRGSLFDGLGELVLLFAKVRHDCVAAALDRLGELLACAREFAGNGVAAGRNGLDELLAARIEQAAQIVRARRKHLKQLAPALAKSAMELRQPVGECAADGVDALGETLSDLSCPGGKRGVEILDGLRDRRLDLFGAAGEELPEVARFAVKGGVDVARMSAERLIDLLRPRGEGLGNGAPRRLKIARCGREAGDDALLELGNPRVEGCGHRGGLSGKRIAKLSGLRREALSNGLRARGERGRNLPGLLIERPHKLASTFRERPG